MIRKFPINSTTIWGSLGWRDLVIFWYNTSKQLYPISKGNITGGDSQTLRKWTPGEVHQKDIYLRTVRNGHLIIHQAKMKLLPLLHYCTYWLTPMIRFCLVPVEGILKVCLDTFKLQATKPQAKPRCCRCVHHHDIHRWTISKPWLLHDPWWNSSFFMGGASAYAPYISTTQLGCIPELFQTRLVHVAETWNISPSSQCKIAVSSILSHPSNLFAQCHHILAVSDDSLID